MNARRLYVGLIALSVFLLALLINGFALAGATSETGILQQMYGVELSSGYSQDAEPGSVVTYTHTLTNTGDGPDIFVLDAVSSHGWPVALLGDAYPTGTVCLPLPLETGLTATFQVSLSVPYQMLSGTLNIITGTKDTIVVTATSQATPTVYVTLTDTTTVRPSGPTGVIFLPLIVNLRPPLAELGVDFSPWLTDTDLLEYDVPLVREMGASWVRVYLPWLDIEKSPGQYSWESYDVVFDRLREMELKPLSLVYGAPEWAAEENCGPISDTLAFEGFLKAVWERYGSYTDAWEFANEPDGRYPHPWGPTAGCWGFYPEAYATQLGIFYHTIKTLDSDALVVFGGLAYDNWEADENVEKDFFTETLKYGAGQFFDVANFHYYPINPIRFPTLAHKVNEIRDIMARNGVQGKRIWVTETGMWVNDFRYDPLQGSLEQQRDFIVQEQTRGFCAGLDNIFWFDVRERPLGDDVVHRWLISIDHKPINGYNTYQHYAGKIAGTYCTGRYEGMPPDVEAYRFVGPGRSLYILWSNTVSQTVAVPAITDTILTDRDGETSRVVTTQGGQVSFEVGAEPVFLEVPY
jgi:hypothetical protein